jgi:HK97 family phage major capsid protein
MESTVEEQLKTLATDINKSIKGLEESAKDGSDAKVKALDLEKQLEVLKGLTKEQSEKVEEIIVKMNRPDFGREVFEKGMSKELEETISKGIKELSFDGRHDSAKVKWDKGQKGLTKAASTITNANFMDGTGAAVSFNPDIDPGLVTSPTRKVHMRSIIPQLPMSGDSIRYKQHKSHGEGEIGIQVAQGDRKQQIEEEYEIVDLLARTIAGFYDVSKQEIADIPFLVQSLLTEGTERFLKVEDEKMLYGVGGANDIKGINEYAILYAGDMPTYYEAILNPIFELLDADEDPNAVLIRPSTYANLLKYKTTTGEYNFPMLFLPNQQMPLNIAGVPINMSTAVRANEGFVGDWSAQNVQIRVREGLSIAFSYENGENFVENLVTIRLEAREALQVKKRNAFRKIDFTGVAPAL